MALTQSEVDIDDSLDERAGFFTHYVLNVSWCPTTCTYRGFLAAIFDFIPQLFLLPCTLGTEQVARYVVTRSTTNTGEGKYCGETVTVVVDAVSCMLCLDIHHIASVVMYLISICRRLQVCNLNPAIPDNSNFHAHRQCRY